MDSVAGVVDGSCTDCDGPDATDCAVADCETNYHSFASGIGCFGELSVLCVCVFCVCVFRSKVACLWVCAFVNAEVGALHGSCVKAVSTCGVVISRCMV